ncbi:hypothetical protein QYS48_29500 [Marivirga arenosa]|uniref:Translocation/assembly module TamB n=1 Tax=Marivirga arenosa TaxID=3059076 RepID=A0AA51RDB9_9BACT|nr:hypothetical protein [Marivirga sp. ABR2-2]WMN07669.1 hypothetical protein QYS48_29500 [Marivirga sp. ABR2-2]
MKSFLICILVLFSFTFSYAQDDENTDVVSTPNFLQTVQLDLSELKSEKGESVSLFFQNYWNKPNFFTKANKDLIHEIYNRMREDNLSVKDFRLPFISTLSGASSNLKDPAKAINSFLEIAEKAYDELDNNQFKVILNKAEQILEKKAIYYSRYYQVAFNGGSVSFEWDKEPEQIPVEETPVEEAEETSSEWGSESNDDWGSSEDAWGSSDSSWGDDSWGSENNESANNSTSTEEDESIDLTAVAEPMPILEGPVVKLKNINLRFFNTVDSIKINGVTGSLELIGNTFVAETGTLTWEHLGKDPKELNAEFSDFTFEVNEKEFSAEQVTLNYPEILSEPVKGLIDFKVENNSNGEVNHPFFQSYKSGYDLNFVKKEGLYLKGGITVKGTTLTTAANNKNLGSLELQGAAVKKFRAESREFIYKDSSFSSDISSVSIYQRKDSIYHPGLTFSYDINNNSINLLKKKGDFKNTPFYASYFNMDFTADKLTWDMDTTILDISILIAGNRVPALFESAEYYNEYRYSSLSGLYRFHALQVTVNYSREIRSNDFYLNEMADYTKIEEKKLRSGMKLLMQNGFIKFDIISGKIEVLDKAYHYVDSRWGRKDYDNIQITSVASGLPNGKLNLDKGTLDIVGVEEFIINDKLGVSVEPDSGKVVLRKNRDIQFDGIVYAGNYQYIGEEFRMDYDSFLISMPQIDNIKFNLATDDDNKRSNKEQIQNQLVETAGVLYINEPNNKSAQKEYPKYPVFNATKGATVYFLGEEILNGVYDQSLYFIIPPFEIDSVSSSDPNSIAFDGVFHSGDIFPEFEEKLRVMPDKSLGFDHPLPDEGIDLLDGEATFYGKIRLDNQGLRGGDRIEYLSSTIRSENFTFFKDSITAVGTYATIDPGNWEGVSFPQLEIANFDMRWLTAKDSLYMTNRSDPFKMYNETASLEGRTIISKKGLFGEGDMTTRGSNTSSKEYSFKEDGFSARHAAFRIESTDTIPALSSDDVRLDFDFEANTATINPEIEGDAALDFPYASYKTSIPSALWKLDEKVVEMTKPADINIRNSYFYSTNPDQDSLVFNATKAVYDIESQALNVSGIPYITVADANITPSAGEVIIGENGEINKLYNATLELDTLTGYHNLYDAEIEIASRNKFSGNATYRYVNSVGDTFSIKMGEFSLEPIPDASKNDKQLRTVSSGVVRKEDRLLMSPGMFFKGDVTMYADKPALELKGYIQPDLRDIPNYDTWIAYTSDGSAKEVVIDFDNSTTEMGEPLQAGIHFDNVSNQLYATFMTEKRDFTDADFFKPSGLLTYNANGNQFVIESKGRKSGTSYAGKYFAYNEEDQKLEFEGPFKFMNSRKEAEFNSAGSGSGDLLNQEFIFNLMMTVEFDLPNGFTQIIGNDMIEVIQRLGLPESTKDLDRLLPKLAEIAGNSAAKRYEEYIFNEYIPLHALSSNLTKTLVLNNLDMKWSDMEQAWYSVGKIGFSNTGAQDINANVDGFVELQKKEMGSAIKLFLQVSPSCWYFFHYEQDRLIFFSSNAGANDLITKKSKADKAKFGEFVFLTGDKSEVISFIEEYRRKYFDIDAPYYLEMASEASSGAAAPVNSNPTPTQEPTPAEDDDDGF